MLFCGFEYWSVRFSEERTIRVFENRVLRKILGFKRDEAKRSGENYITSSLMICTPHPIFFDWKIEKYEMGGTCSTYGERRGKYSILVRKPDRNKSFGRTRCRWKGNVKMDLKDLGRRCMEWIDLAPCWERWWTLSNAVMNFLVT